MSDKAELLKALKELQERQEEQKMREALAQNIKTGPMGPQPRYSEVGPPEHMQVGGVLNLLNNDVGQLLDVIAELRGRLSPLLVSREEKVGQPREGLPVRSRLAEELANLHAQIHQARQMVETTLLDLDL